MIKDRSQSRMSEKVTLPKPSFGRFALLLIIILLFATSSGAVKAGSEELDTTRVRETRKIKLSFGEALTEVPGEVLKLPFRVLEVVTKTLTDNPVSGGIENIYKWASRSRIWVPVAGYSSNTGLKLGFGIQKTEGLGPDDKVRFKWYYSTNNYQMYDFRFRFMNLFSPRVGLDANIFYRARTRERFYGIGMDTDTDNEARIYSEKTAVNIAIPIQLSKIANLTLTGGYEVNNLFDGEGTDGSTSLDSISSNPIYGIRDGQLNSSRFAKIGGSFTIDLRHVPGEPSQGAWFSTDYAYYSGNNRSDGLNFSRYSFDLRFYQNVWRRRLLAFRVHMRRFDGNDSNDKAAPVNVLQSLGGVQTLRGYISGRFVDNDMAMASVEYRYPVHESLDAFVLYEQGRVFDSITQRRVLEGWRYSSGMGFRVGTFQAVKLMTQLAFSADGARFYIEMGADW